MCREMRSSLSSHLRKIEAQGTNSHPSSLIISPSKTEGDNGSLARSKLCLSTREGKG